MAPDEKETLEELARIAGELGRSLAYLQLAIQDLAEGEPRSQPQPPLRLVRDA